MIWDARAERAVLAWACREDLWAFTQWAWGVRLNPKGTWFDPYVDQPLCRWLQIQARRWLKHRRCGVDRKLLICQPRDTAKTVKITKAFHLWLHLQDPDISSAMGSADYPRAAAFLTAMKQVMDGTDQTSLFAQIYGSWRHPLRAWREDRIVHAQRESLGVSEPSIDTFSVETGMTAYHPDVAFIDDPITIDKLSETGSWITKVNRFLIGMIPVVRKDGLTVFVGTPYEDGDAITTLLREEGVASITGQQVPFEVKKGGPWHVFYLPAQSPEGEVLYPKVWSLGKIAAYEERSPMDAAAQIHCNPLAGEHIPLTAEQIDEMWVELAHVPKNLRFTIHLDTAFKTIQTIGRGDDSVIVVAGHAVDGSGDVYYHKALVSNRWRSEEFLDLLVQVVQQVRGQGGIHHHISYITDERPIGGHTEIWENQLRSFFGNLNVSMPTLKMIDRSKGPSKPDRLREVAGFWVDGHVKLVRGGVGLDRLVGQMLRNGKPKDDIADAAADAFFLEVYRPTVGAYDDGPSRTPKRPYDDLLQGGRTGDYEFSYERHGGRTPI
jgi:hypothetical protein